jgi:hypothetical protein
LTAFEAAKDSLKVSRNPDSARDTRALARIAAERRVLRSSSVSCAVGCCGVSVM